MVILGVNVYHPDSAAAIVKDGELVAAAEEERFRRIKHWAGFPSEAIRYCLSAAGLRPSDVDCIAVNQKTGANLWRKVAYLAMNRPNLSFIFDRIKNKSQRMDIATEFIRAFPEDSLRAEIREVEHHYAHLSSAFFVSSFQDATVVSVDGFGDFASAAWGQGHFNSINVENKIYFPHSLGIFYMALTQYLGFQNWGDEYKVMGLAPYGQEKFMDAMRQIVQLKESGIYHLNLEFFRHHKEKTDMELHNGEPRVAELYTPALENLLGPSRKKDDELMQRHKDIACSVQAMYEEAFFHLLNHIYSCHGMETLALAGGCAMNSVANGKIYERSPFRKVYIQAASGDAGGAIGAAFAVWNKVLGNPRTFVMEHAYYGPEFSHNDVIDLIHRYQDELERLGCQVKEVVDLEILCQRTASAIADGYVIGWFQGRMEWGPRALGNRSILSDPRRPDMKDILNLKIKRRESFRPFAPSILREAVKEWFETDDDVPFMLQVYQIREEKRKEIPAVTHVNGSGRLQTVTEKQNSRYYRLIKAFEKLTGVPIVLNTSFNENEPVVCTPAEAMACFLRTQMDMLVLENWIISRHPFCP